MSTILSNAHLQILLPYFCFLSFLNYPTGTLKPIEYESYNKLFYFEDFHLISHATLAVPYILVFFLVN